MTNNFICQAVLIIPAIYNRAFIKQYMTVLLNKIGFSQAFVVQDHVAATFGAGLSQACVVDVGDQKTSVSCVEDGISHPQSRVQLNVGGSDITQIFFFLCSSFRASRKCSLSKSQPKFNFIRMGKTKTRGTKWYYKRILD